MTANRRLAKRYAKALGELAVERGLIEKVQDDLGRVVAAIRSDDAVRFAVENKQVPAQVKMDLLLTLAGEDAADLTKQFLRLVVQKRREEHLPAMLDEYVAYADWARGIVEVEVKTAKPLGRQEADRLMESLAAFTGKQVRLKNVVEPKILGGVVARIGDLVVDGSVARRLERLKETLQQTRLESVG